MHEEIPVELFKCVVESYGELVMESLASPKASPIFDFDELFQQLKLKVASIDLLEDAHANLPILDELQELVLKLSLLEAFALIYIMVLDLEILLDQAIQTVASKGDSAKRVKEKVVSLT